MIKGDPNNKGMVLGIPVSPTVINIPDDLDTASELNQPLLMTAVNPLACAIDLRNSEYVGLLSCIDWVQCDGIGMVLAARWTKGLQVQRATFDQTSLAAPVFHWAVANNRPLMLVGGQVGVADQAAEVLKASFSGLDIAATFSGYQDSPDNAQAFALKHPNMIVICGMGAPLQEAFLIDLKNGGWPGIGFTCGGFLDQLSSGLDYFPAWVNRFHLRFLYRLLKEPRRLWRRYLIDYQVFLKRLVKALWQKYSSGSVSQ